MATDNTLVGSSGGLQINLIWDPSVLALAASTLSAFEAATVQAAEAFTSIFSNPMTLNIRVGYGEIDGAALSANDLGTSETYDQSYTYQQVAGGLKAVDGASTASALQKSAAASLPATDPSTITNFLLGSAEAKVLGLQTATNTVSTDNTSTGYNPAIDGYVGFSSVQPLSFNLTGAPPAGDYDYVNVAEHEISEVMGRISGLQFGVLSAEDLFRYSAPGVRDFSGTATTASNSGVYLSGDGGATAIAYFNSDPSGDFGDWNGATSDSFNAFGTLGVEDPVTPADDETMNLLGYNLVSQAVCFYAGVLIATPEGPRAVETLKAGDFVTIVGGGSAPLRWLGRQTVSTRFADPLRVLPIRIRAGALEEGVPSRDLLVSPDHALLLDGLLVQAGALVNGVTILRESDVPGVFVYYHLETADHSLILAEGAPAETFIDNVDRLAFDNWDEHAAIAEAPPLNELNLPRVKSARQLPQAMRRRLAARLQALSPTAADRQRA